MKSFLLETLRTPTVHDEMDHARLMRSRRDLTSVSSAVRRLGSANEACVRRGSRVAHLSTFSSSPPQSDDPVRRVRRMEGLEAQVARVRVSADGQQSGVAQTNPGDLKCGRKKSR